MMLLANVCLFSQNHVDVSIITANEADAAILGFAVAPGANAPSFTVGVRGIAQTANGLGVYGQGPTALRGDQDQNGFFAGFFLGNVHVSGTFDNPSDRKLKTIIKNEKEVLPLILKLKPTSYKYKTDVFPSMNLREGIQKGFIAQELEAVFPEMVNSIFKPESYNAQGEVVSERIDYKAVNYLDLIPILTQGIQELSKLLETQAIEIQNLKNRLSKIE